MSAERKAIRQSLKAILTGKTAAGARVYTNRAEINDASELPLVLIYSRSESSDIFDAAPKRYRRTARIVVEVLAKGTNLDDVLDDEAEKIEQAIALDDTLGNTASDTRISEIDFNSSADGADEIASLRMTLDVDYMKEAPSDISNSLSAFKTANIQYDLSVPDGRIDATDTIKPSQS